MAISKITSASLDQSAGAPSWDTSGNTTLTGNLTISGTGKRITGDFSNATLANRLAFQTSTTNGVTALWALPNGTGTNTNITAFNNSDPTNAGNIQIRCGTTAAELLAGITGTGTYLPLIMYTGGSERLRIDTSGKVGIGNSSPYAGLDLGKYGTAWNSDYQYSKPAGNVFIGMAGVSSQDNWFGFTGAYGASTGSANLLLQANYLDVGHQGGNYVGSEATGAGQAALTFGKVTSAGTVNGNASKTEHMRIDAAGNVGFGGAASTWSNYVALEGPSYGNALAFNTSTTQYVLTNNAYYNAGWKYKTNAAAGLLLCDASGMLHYNAASGTAGNAVSWVNDLCVNAYGIGLGNTTPASGCGVKFPATQSASSDANTLDDYEEGTFSPYFANGASSTYASRIGYYRKIGSVCYFWIDLSLSAQSGTSGGAQIIGLPFTGIGVNQGVGCINGDNNWPTPRSNLAGIVYQGTLYVYYNSGTNLISVNMSDIGNSGRFIIGGSYIVA